MKTYSVNFVWHSYDFLLKWLVLFELIGLFVGQNKSLEDKISKISKIVQIDSFLCIK